LRDRSSAACKGVPYGFHQRYSVKSRRVCKIVDIKEILYSTVADPEGNDGLQLFCDYRFRVISAQYRCGLSQRSWVSELLRMWPECIAKSNIDLEPLADGAKPCLEGRTNASILFVGADWVYYDRCWVEENRFLGRVSRTDGRYVPSNRARVVVTVR